jgi:alpha-galactosidase
VDTCVEACGLLGCWVGVSMNVNQEVMDQMMADFAAMGGEMFVMDDGWFGDKYPRNNEEEEDYEDLEDLEKEL